MVADRPILLKNSVCRAARKIAAPQRLRCISDAGGTRAFLLSATKSLLIGPLGIHRSNWRSRFNLARKFSECIFEFFNRIGHLETFIGDAKISRKQSPADGHETLSEGVAWFDFH